MSPKEAAYYKGRLAVVAGALAWFGDRHIAHIRGKDRLSARALKKLRQAYVLVCEVGGELDDAKAQP